ncbi:SusC/RagA family TonB-linked outer membrane protein [Flavobacterium hiemivividum]|uniref:SusC/RagA family TonB-linked outer membrane protein n=2 Tax=Flavobacterium hiemivividum TaxID=2541734 RepID=A0A4R5CV95_9FLAO|nr:SusC/RagA family TonB-linked outer membrane protein [Flavobacterium hiemivividum]
MKKLSKSTRFDKPFFKFDLKMKLTTLLLLTTLSVVHATGLYSQKTKVSLIANNIEVAKVIEKIESETDYKFIFNNRSVNLDRTIDIKVKDETINSVLNILFKGTSTDYKVTGTHIVLTSKQEPISNQFSNSKANADIVIRGTVTDEMGLPLVGVSIAVRGTSQGTFTNFDGKFELALTEKGKILVFSHLGYKPASLKITNQTDVNIVLEAEVNELEEVVLVGYGNQKRTEFSGAVSSVSTKDIVQAATGTIGFDRALGGLVKGLQVSQNTGRPGAPVRINIRGITSPLSAGGLNQPLFVIDGVPFNIDAMQGANPLSTLNPNDIESFDVLKDAGATAIYGSRGANGVIIIKTKRGKKGQAPRVNFSYATTLAQPVKTVGVLNASQYKNYYNLLLSNTVGAMNSGQLDPFVSFDLEGIANVAIDWDTFMVNYDGIKDDYFGTADTDWNKEVFRSMAITRQANLSLSGGSDKTNYNFSSSFIDQEGLTVNDEFKQYNLGLSVDTELSDYVRLGSSINVGHTEANSGENDILNQFTVNTSIARARPDLPVRDENGKLLGQMDWQYAFFPTMEPNPLMRLSNKTNNKSYNLISSAYLEVEPLKDLKIKTDVNASVFYNRNSSFIPKISETDFLFFPNDSYLSEDDGLVSNVTTNLTANYEFNISDHKIGLLAGAAWDNTNFNSKSNFYAGFPDDEVLINASAARTVIGYSSNRVETGLYSLFSRLNYGYKNLYNATLNFRTDTSSKFGPGNKRGYFPSLSASWNVSNEEFLLDSEKVNVLKLRASIGRVGSTNVSDFAYLQFFQTQSGNIYNGNSAVVPEDNFPNPTIGWESTDEVNLGLDFGFFNNRLKGSVDVYDRKTTDALTRTPSPKELGPATYYSNFMDVTNRGVEVSIGGDIVRSEDFVWSTNVNWSFNRNKLVKLNGASINPFQLDYYIEGQPVGTIKGYKVAKIFQTQDEVDALNNASPTGIYDKMSTSVGDFMMEDVNGDGQITIDDRAIIGNIQPDFFGGISNTFAYKNFSLNALLQYSVGAKSIWNAIPTGVYNSLGENKYSEYALNTWTPENPNARYAKALYSDPSANGRVSDRYIYDTSYLRLRSLQFSYNFEQQLLDKIGVDRATLTLTGTNLVTWTKWPGIDPETFSERGTITDQINNEDPYPLAKSFSLGIQVQF